MKNFLVCIILLTALICLPRAQAQPPTSALTPRVDPRVELLSIVFHLAGNPEYNMSGLPAYTAEIDSVFADFRAHPAVELAKRLAKTKGVAYDAVMAMAVHLTPPPDLRPVVEFSDSLPEARWGERDALRMADLLRDFSRETRFEVFFDRHRDLYRVAEERLAVVTAKVDLGWYASFFGVQPGGSYHVLIGMNNGGGNYGPSVRRPDGRNELFSIIGAGESDSTGLPIFNDEWLSTLIHEFSHSFVNPVIDAHWIAFVPAAHTVYKPVAEQLSKMAYGRPRTMVCESFVRAAVSTYLRAHAVDSATVWRDIRREQVQGFVWMDDLMDSLAAYERQRAIYPTFESYVPVMGRWFAGLATRINDEIADFEGHCAHVTSLTPFQNQATAVKPTVQQIIVHFDKPLNTDRPFTLRDDPAGGKPNPANGAPVYDGDKLTLAVAVKLKPATDYAFVLSGADFQTVDGYPLRRYTVQFRTR